MARGFYNWLERRMMKPSEGGGSELPIGAIPCDLIYSTGYTSFIDTDIVPVSSMSYEADVCWIKPNNEYSAFFGYYISSVRFSLHLSKSSCKVEAGYGNYYTGTWPESPYRVLHLYHRVSVTPSGAMVQSYSSDGVLLDTQNMTYSESVSFNQTIGLLGRKNKAHAIESGCFRGGLGRFKLYGDANFGSLVADFIPCYYNGNFGMWDTVSKTHLIGNVPADIFGLGEAWNTSGFIPNARNSSNSANVERSGYLIDYRGEVASPMFEIPDGCTHIRFNAGTVASTNYALFFFKQDKTYINWYNYNSADREVTTFANSAYLRMSMARDLVSTCYIYDMDNSQYIWKGTSV